MLLLALVEGWGCSGDPCPRPCPRPCPSGGESEVEVIRMEWGFCWD
jgi:hypothetical protein